MKKNKYYYNEEQVKIIHNYLFDFGKAVSLYSIAKAIMKHEKKLFRGKSFPALYLKISNIARYNQLPQVDPYRFVGLVYQSIGTYKVPSSKPKASIRARVSRGAAVV